MFLFLFVFCWKCVQCNCFECNNKTKTVNAFFHKFPANIWALACICRVRCRPVCEWGLLRAHAHTHRGAEVRNDLFFWEFAMICEESKRDYWIWTWRLFPAGWLADLGCWLAASMMTDWVFCRLTTRQAHWLRAGLLGWLPAWLIPLLNVLKTVGLAAHLLNINGESSEQRGGQRVFCWTLQSHSDTSCICAAWNIFASLQSPATGKASLSEQNLCKRLTSHTFWALVHLWGNKIRILELKCNINLSSYKLKGASIIL